MGVGVDGDGDGDVFARGDTIWRMSLKACRTCVVSRNGFGYGIVIETTARQVVRLRQQRA